MSNQTIAILKEGISLKQIHDIIVSKLDKNAEIEIIKGLDYTTSEYIIFEHNTKEINLHYFRGKNEEDGTELKLFKGQKVTYLCVNKTDISSKIMIEIVKPFGGYIIDSDMDNKPCYYIPKSEE